MKSQWASLLLGLPVLAACDNAKDLLSGANEGTAASPASSAAAPPAPTAVPSPSAPDPSALARAVARSEAAASAALANQPAPFDGKYALDGLRALPSNCKRPIAILTALPRKVVESDKFEWHFAKQVFLANPQLSVVVKGNLAPSQGPNAVHFATAVHKPTAGVALYAECNTSEACQQAAAAYKVVVPTSQPELVCGDTPTLGEVSEVFLMTGLAKNDLPPRDHVIQQCVRLAACQARRDGKLEGDPAIECQRKPSSFPLACSRKASCDEVLACVEKG
jgi:hypothetical protein